MEKLLVVDGSSLLFQSFYGMPNRIKNKHGEFVEAVVCFVGILLKTIRLTNAHQILVVFDGETQLERKEIDETYKANRPDFSQVDKNETPFPQLEIIKKVLTHLNFQWTETTSCEADDLIASLANDYSKNLEIIISSQDKDFFQLIGDHVSVFSYRGKVSKMWTSKTIFEKYGFEAKYFSTLKSLSGDSSDNIKGVAGIGIKTATDLIQNFGDIFSIYESLDKIKEKTATLLKENKSRVLKNYSLVELNSKTNFFTLPDCSFVFPEINSTQILKNLDIL